MDKDVLIAFISAIERILSRLNSKRLMTFYAFLLFLYYCQNPLALYLGSGAFLITIWMFYESKTPDTLENA